MISTKSKFRIDHRFGDGGGDCVYAKLSMGWFSVDINNQIHEIIQVLMKGSAYIFLPIKVLFSAIGLIQSKVLT